MNELIKTIFASVVWTVLLIAAMAIVFHGTIKKEADVKRTQEQNLGALYHRVTHLESALMKAHIEIPFDDNDTTFCN